MYSDIEDRLFDIDVFMCISGSFVDPLACFGRLTLKAGGPILECMGRIEHHSIQISCCEGLVFVRKSLHKWPINGIIKSILV